MGHITKENVSNERSLKSRPYKNVGYPLSDDETKNLTKGTTFSSAIQRLLQSKDRPFGRQELIDRMKELFPKKYERIGKNQFESNIDVTLSRFKTKGLIKRIKEGLYAHGAYDESKLENIDPELVKAIKEIFVKLDVKEGELTILEHLAEDVAVLLKDKIKGIDYQDESFKRAFEYVRRKWKVGRYPESYQNIRNLFRS